MKKVLIVEDDPFILDITSIKLTEYGCEVSAAVTGEAAILALKNNPPDVLLLDLDLPDISGFQIAALMKEDEKLKDIPIIIFSNRDDEETKQKALQLGIEHFFIKASTDYDQLHALLDSLSNKLSTAN